MSNCFRYADHPEDQTVSLRLFTGADGRPQGDVCGPQLGYAFTVAGSVIERLQCSTLDDAFAAGIRLANKNDTDLIILGDAALWCSKWGTLDLSSTAGLRRAG